MTSTGREGCLACTHLDGGVFCENRPSAACWRTRQDGTMEPPAVAQQDDELSAEDRITELVFAGAGMLRSYLRTSSTNALRRLGPVVVELRGLHTLADGRTDWSGRSPGYRAAIADLYRHGGLTDDIADTVQAALRYHVGNLLRDRADDDELAAVGLKVTSPKERLAAQRQRHQAMHRRLAGCTCRCHDTSVDGDQ